MAQQHLCHEAKDPAAPGTCPALRPPQVLRAGVRRRRARQRWRRLILVAGVPVALGDCFPGEDSPSSAEPPSAARQRDTSAPHASRGTLGPNGEGQTDERSEDALRPWCYGRGYHEHLSPEPHAGMWRYLRPPAFAPAPSRPHPHIHTHTHIAQPIAWLAALPSPSCESLVTALAEPSRQVGLAGPPLTRRTGAQRHRSFPVGPRGAAPYQGFSCFTWMSDVTRASADSVLCMVSHRTQL